MHDRIPPKMDSLALAVLLAIVAASLAGCSLTFNSKGSDPPPPGTETINGTVVDDSTNQPVAGAMVAVEQADAKGIDRIVASTTTASGGAFAFNALTKGNYDVVADASVSRSDGTTATYAATVTFAAPTGTTLRGIPLMPEFGNAFPTGVPAQIAGVVASARQPTGPAPVDVKLSALQHASNASGTVIVEVTIPAFNGSAAEITTETAPGCPTGTACANYVLLVPSSDPVAGSFNPLGTIYQFPSSSPSGPVEVIYFVEGRAFVHGSPGMADCTPSTETVGPVVPRGTLPSVIPNITFAGCQ